MSRVMELPDNFDEALNLNDLPENATLLEDLYYQKIGKDGAKLPAKSGKSFEQTMSEFSKTPLFMTDIDEAGDAEGENDALDAIRALQYEGTKAEIAQGFKEQGNEMVQSKSWSDAKEFYTKGIAVLTDQSDGKWEAPEDVQAETTKQKALEEQMYTNRALCNLELKNYRSTTLDCAAALRINPSNIKAHYRSASALLALDKVLEASDLCYRGLKLDPTTVALQKLSEQIQTRIQAKDDKARKVKAELLRKRREHTTLQIALKARGIQLRGSAKPPDLEDAVIRLSPDPLSPQSMLEFPVLLLYPLHNQSDFIKTAAEKDPLVHHLSYIMPLPWDTKGEYKVATVECYMDTISGGMVKVGKKVSLLEALSSGKTEIVDGLVRIHVVPSSSSRAWIEEVKKKRATDGRLY